MIIGPTVDRVTNGNGARARWTSVKKMNWSVGRASLAPVLDRPADAEPAVGAHLADDPAERLAALGLGVEVVAHLGGEQLGEVGPELGAQCQLVRRLFEVHGGFPPLSDLRHRQGGARESVDVVSAPPARAGAPVCGSRRTGSSAPSVPHVRLGRAVVRRATGLRNGGGPGAAAPMITDTRSRNVTAAQARLPAIATGAAGRTGVPPGGIHMELADIDLCDPGKLRRRRALRLVRPAAPGGTRLLAPGPRRARAGGSGPSPASTTASGSTVTTSTSPRPAGRRSSTTSTRSCSSSSG